MTPKDKCQIAPRLFIKKGWGVKLRECVPILVSPHRKITRDIDDLVGEIFVYHKDYPDETNKNPTFEVGTVKILHVAKGKKLSLHFHKNKEEIFYMVKGALQVILISDGIQDTIIFEEGDTLYIPPCMVHQMKGLRKENILLEVSTKDKSEDSYRIEKGD